MFVDNLHRKGSAPRTSSSRGNQALLQNQLESAMTSLKQIPRVPNVYVPPPAAGVKTMGTPMKVNSALMTSLGIPLNDFSILSEDTVSDFVFVTGASNNHYQESLDAIGGVQHLMPDYKIYYYDLGLAKSQVNEVQTFCNVVYRKFEFGKYPDHVAKLKTYSFKGLIIHDMLKTHRSIVWMDASFRLKQPMSMVYSDLIKSGGFLQLRGGARTNFAVTNPLMYEYITTNISRQKETTHAQANCLFIHNTEGVYWGIIYWWAMCSLDVNCIAPVNSKLMCKLPKDSYTFLTTYHDCHRFDQSLMGLLASNLHGYNSSLYINKNNKLVEILRKVTHLYTAQKCNGNKPL